MQRIPITYYLLPITYYLLPITYYLLPITYYLLPITYYISNQRIRNLNQQIAQIAQQEGAAYLNVHKLFTDSKGQMQHNLTTDGIHLTPLGYQVWQEALQYTESLIAANRAKALSL
ncbi:MAG: hypothetical protein F6K37_02175 [Moorea sp. SIO4E2]|uniref:GDSL-type esterase/lipase family protein n=1 Tax=Moorena sp. SIO4E2 TaxID=2607826 RepID=UPI0013BC46BD|nr:GDSL-type esterase/lipase family protein [Moorena sp. SIO4E2]NEQ04832.1 hypothetical protein [Moorena sp. SIO4E2]